MRKGIVLVLILCGMSYSLRAQQIARKITLQEAINIALKNNYQLKQADNNVKLADANILGAKADFLPSISGSLSGTITEGQQFNNTTISFENEISNGVSGRLSASVPIFQGFRNIINLRRSNTNKDYAEQNKQRARETVIFNAASNFLQVILNEQLLKISQGTLESSQKEQEQIQAQVDVGSVATVDLYNQQSTVASNELKVIQQQNALSYSKTQLASTLQLDPEKDYDFVTPDLKDFSLVPTDLDLHELITEALNNRSDLKAQKLLIKRNREDLGLARANYYPNISAQAGISTRYTDQYRSFDLNSSDPTQRVPVSFSDQFFNKLINKFIGFSINVPIFNNLQTRINVQSAKINYENSQYQYQNLKYSALQEVRQAYNDYTSYSKQLESSAKALKAAKKSFDTQQERYNVGAGSLIELSNANAQYVQAQADRAQAVLRFVFQKKLLDYYLGNIDKNISLN